MNEFIKKLIERLEESSHWEQSTFDEDGYCNDDSEEAIYLYRAIEIVNQLAEEYKIFGNSEQVKTNFDICCESVENMAQVIDIAKCGWTKEQIVAWLQSEAEE